MVRLRGQCYLLNSPRFERYCAAISRIPNYCTMTLLEKHVCTAPSGRLLKEE